MNDIVTLLEERGITVSDAAQELGVTRRKLFRKIWAEQPFKLEEAKKLADMLDCTIDGLFYNSFEFSKGYYINLIGYSLNSLDERQLELVWFFIKHLTDKKEATADDPDPAR